MRRNVRRPGGRKKESIRPIHGDGRSWTVHLGPRNACRRSRPLTHRFDASMRSKLGGGRTYLWQFPLHHLSLYCFVPQFGHHRPHENGKAPRPLEPFLAAVSPGLHLHMGFSGLKDHGLAHLSRTYPPLLCSTVCQIPQN